MGGFVNYSAQRGTLRELTADNFQFIGRPEIIGIQEHKKLSICLADAEIEGMPLAAVVSPDYVHTISVLLEFRSGISGMLAAVRSTPLFWRIHVFGRDGSAEALGRTELVLRQSGKEPERRRFKELPRPRRLL